MSHPNRLLGVSFVLLAVVMATVTVTLVGLSGGTPVSATPPHVPARAATEATAQPATPSPSPPSLTSTRADLLQQDSVMIEQMSTPNASGPMQDGRIQEPMLQRSLDAGYVRALEQHHAELDRMLARNQ